MDTFEINSDCSGWFNHHVKVLENKKRTLFSNHVYHEYKGKKVIGYICGDEPPQYLNVVRSLTRESYIEFVFIN